MRPATGWMPKRTTKAAKQKKTKKKRATKDLNAHLSGHAASDGVDAEAHVVALVAQLLGHVGHGVLRLGHSQTCETKGTRAQARASGEGAAMGMQKTAAAKQACRSGQLKLARTQPRAAETHGAHSTQHAAHMRR